ncbi:TMEM175 family protein [Spirosoma sp. SC4-14]|uniref:TMEM175 family protein n=1 Tax=Spirosoma sp. SC4-14 TaxID=3128900 RepID=UPI0030CB72C9
MSTYNKISGQRIQRIEALSDGLFSIAMTILVFDLKDPVSDTLQSNTELLLSLKSLLPKLLTYFLSFMTLGIFWTGHSTQFNYIVKYDRNLSWYSLFFLLFVSIIPFTTNILSNHIANELSIGIYWFNIFALGTMLFIHWDYAYKHDYLSLHDEKKILVDQAVRSRIRTAQSLYFFCALLCFVSTYLSIACIIAIQLNYALGIVSSQTQRPE